MGFSFTYRWCWCVMWFGDFFKLAYGLCGDLVNSSKGPPFYFNGWGSPGRKNHLLCVWWFGDISDCIREEITSGVCGDLVISSKGAPFHINVKGSPEKITYGVCGDFVIFQLVPWKNHRWCVWWFGDFLKGSSFWFQWRRISRKKTPMVCVVIWWYFWQYLRRNHLWCVWWFGDFF